MNATHATSKKKRKRAAVGEISGEAAYEAMFKASGGRRPGRRAYGECKGIVARVCCYIIISYIKGLMFCCCILFRI